MREGQKDGSKRFTRFKKVHKGENGENGEIRVQSYDESLAAGCGILGVTFLALFCHAGEVGLFRMHQSMDGFILLLFSCLECLFSCRHLLLRPVVHQQQLATAATATAAAAAVLGGVALIHLRQVPLPLLPF